MIFKNKKSQLILLAGFILFSLLFFIYSLETDNSYKLTFQDNYIVDNIIYEVCQVGYMSNGSNIDSRFTDYDSKVTSYCNDLDYTCNLVITKQVGAPPVGNISLNYTYYDFEMEFEGNNHKLSYNFTC